MRQLQEDRKNDKKPPPYKHIKVSSHARLCFTVRGNVPLTWPPPFLRWTGQLERFNSLPLTCQRFHGATAKPLTRTPAMWTRSALIACWCTSATRRCARQGSDVRTRPSQSASTRLWRFTGRCPAVGVYARCRTLKRSGKMMASVCSFRMFLGVS